MEGIWRGGGFEGGDGWDIEGSRLGGKRWREYGGEGWEVHRLPNFQQNRCCISSKFNEEMLGGMVKYQQSNFCDVILCFWEGKDR